MISFVFDEIDTGISGATASAVGARLNKLASTNQALVITHSAQVAGFADGIILSKQFGAPIYIAEALMDKYRNLPIITELDIVLIRETVQKIAVNKDGTLTVTFINHAEVTNIETEEQTA